MNFLKIFSVGILLLGASEMNAQNKETTKEKPVDNPPKCNMIKDGKFIKTNYPESLWYMTVKENVQTEYYNSGKDYIKSTLVFVDDCNYKSIVVEKSEKENPIKVGDVFSNKILATQDDYLKIQTQLNGDSFDFVLAKVKENKKSKK